MSRPATEGSPQGHAPALRLLREFTQWPALGETAARESIASVPFRLLQTNAVSTVPAENPPRPGSQSGTVAML
jgi:hypothetical protein